MDRPPSTWRILTGDTVALVAVVFLVACLGELALAAIGDATAALGRQTGVSTERRTPYALSCTGISLAVALPVGLWRVSKVRAFFGRAVPSTAMIDRVRVGIKGGLVDYHYEYAGQSFVGHALVGPDTYLNLMKKGDEVNILLDPEDPGWTVIRGVWEG